MWQCPFCGLSNHEQSLSCQACFKWDPKRTGLPFLTEELEKHGQSHLLAFASQITDDEFESLVTQIRSIDMDEIDSLWKQVLKQREQSTKSSLSSQSSSSTDAKMSEADKQQDSGLEVTGFPKERQFTIEMVQREKESWTEVGLDGIIRGHCAVIIMAGGQGTRLGAKLPKGMVDLGLASGKTLLRLHCEKIRKVQQMALDYYLNSMIIDYSDVIRHRGHRNLKDQIQLPLYIMTSTDTYLPTLNYLRKNRYFGLNSRSVRLFKQREYPLLNPDNGRIMLKSAHQIQFGPNGNGGLYSSLITQNESNNQLSILEEMSKKGVKQIQVIGVDNVLAKVGDPCWFGHCLSAQLSISNKCGIKREPNEKVGVMCLRYQRYPHVIEYSEMSNDEMKKDPCLQCANLCMHSFSLDFLIRLINNDDFQMPIHEALKSMSIVINTQETQDKLKKQRMMMNSDDDGSDSVIRYVSPLIDTRKILKMEHFIFDSFEMINDLNEFSVFNIHRNDEFSPVKNKCGKDSPYTARKSLTSLWIERLFAAGAQLSNYSSQDSTLPLGDELAMKSKTDDRGSDCEVSPLVSYEGEGLSWLKDQVLSLPLKIEMVRGKPTVIDLGH